jgi:hypothetical protein
MNNATLFVRARAALILKAAIGELAAYMGVTGGAHIFRDSRKRVWAVDLVTGGHVLCVGLPSSQWRHPPRV